MMKFVGWRAQRAQWMRKLTCEGRAVEDSTNSEECQPRICAQILTRSISIKQQVDHLRIKNDHQTL